MIEIDLLPGGGRPADGTSSGAPVPRKPVRVLLRDPWFACSASIVILSAVMATVLLLAGRGRAAELEGAFDRATRDSVRIGIELAKAEQLESRLDSIRDRADIIKRMDSRRYVWPRLLDELARALPEEAWLVQIAQVTADSGQVRFRVEGETLGNLALSRFWDGMESSDFIDGVRLLSTEHLVDPFPASPQSRTGYFFVLEAEYQEGPPGSPDPGTSDLLPATT